MTVSNNSNTTAKAAPNAAIASFQAAFRFLLESLKSIVIATVVMMVAWPMLLGAMGNSWILVILCVIFFLGVWSRLSLKTYGTAITKFSLLLGVLLIASAIVYNRTPVYYLFQGLSENAWTVIACAAAVPLTLLGTTLFNFIVRNSRLSPAHIAALDAGEKNDFDSLGDRMSERNAKNNQILTQLGGNQKKDAADNVIGFIFKMLYWAFFDTRKINLDAKRQRFVLEFLASKSIAAERATEIYKSIVQNKGITNAPQLHILEFIPNFWKIPDGELPAELPGHRYNAFIARVGGTERMILSSHLVEALSEDELVALIGHELSHYKFHDIDKGTLAFNGVFVAVLALSLLFADPLDRALALVAMPGLVIIAIPLAKMALLAISRKREFAADLFASSIAGPDAVASLLVKVCGEQLYTNRAIAALSTHPTVNERIENVMTNGASQAKKSLKQAA